MLDKDEDSRLRGWAAEKVLQLAGCQFKAQEDVDPDKNRLIITIRDLQKEREEAEAAQQTEQSTVEVKVRVGDEPADKEPE
jgi:hypothetical protein